jgi:hypothetical protein
MDKKPFKIVGNVLELPSRGSDFDEQFETLIKNLRDMKDEIRALAFIINLKDGSFATSAVNTDPVGVVFMAEVLKTDAMDRAKGN